MLKFLLSLPPLCEEPTIKERMSAVTPIDGRYGKTTAILRNFCSEAGLQRLRTLVEVEWLIFFCGLVSIPLSDRERESLRAIVASFTLDDAVRIKEIERKTNHDVKCVEYFVKEKLEELGLTRLKQYVHILLTSEDVTNVAYALMVKAGKHYLLNMVLAIKLKLEEYAYKWKNIPMLSRTHGQPASPTTVGKEFVIFANRLNLIQSAIEFLEVTAKFNGASGNFNAHQATYPNINWIEASQGFIRDKFGLEPEVFTGQTNHYLYLANIFNQFTNLSATSIDLARDMWMYISYVSFGQKLKQGETGSSTMPHKVNPIYFENAEGNFGIAIAFCQHMAVKLQISRLQRDLSDSTVLRNIGSVFGYLFIALNNLALGLDKITINKEMLKKDLENNPAVISEAIQQVLRECGVTDSYEKLKDITRGKEVSLEDLRKLILSYKDVLGDKFESLYALTPESYTVFAVDLVYIYF